VEQYQLAVAGGCAAANARLGLCFEKGSLCFEKGRGALPSDPAEATWLYALAAEGSATGEEESGEDESHAHEA
jgi:TPR repeat protein